MDYPSASRARFALLVLTIAYTVSFIDRQALSLLVEPIRRDLSLSDMQVGMLQGFAFATVYAVAGLPLGRAADQFNRRNIILVGVAFWSLMTSLCGVARSFTSILICRGGVGIGEAALSPSAYSMLSDSFPPRQLPAAMSVYNLGPSIGSGLSYLLGGVILAFAGDSRSIKLNLPFLTDVRPWQITFIVLGGLGLIVISLLYFVTEPRRRVQATEPESASFTDTIHFLKTNASSVATLFVGLSLLGVLSYATMTWYPTMLVRSFDEPVSRTGLVFGPLYIVASIVGNLGGAWCALKVSDRGHRNPYVRWAAIAAVLVTCVGTAAPLIPSLHMTYAAATVLIVFQSTWMGPAVAGLHLVVPNHMRAQLTAILLLCTNLIGLSLGPSIVAAITQYVFQDTEALRYSLSIVSLVAGTLAVVTLWFSWRNFPKLRSSASATPARMSTAGA
jgi:MFS family permease